MKAVSSVAIILMQFVTLVVPASPRKRGDIFFGGDAFLATAPFSEI